MGRVFGIRDIITFHGENVTDVCRALQEAVDFYLESCAESVAGKGENWLTEMSTADLRSLVKLRK